MTDQLSRNCVIIFVSCGAFVGHLLVAIAPCVTTHKVLQNTVTWMLAFAISVFQMCGPVSFVTIDCGTVAYLKLQNGKML